MDTVLEKGRPEYKFYNVYNGSHKRRILSTAHTNRFTLKIRNIEIK